MDEATLEEEEADVRTHLPMVSPVQGGGKTLALHIGVRERAG